MLLKLGLGLPSLEDSVLSEQEPVTFLLDGVAGVTSAFSSSRDLLSTFNGDRYTLTSGKVSSWNDQSGNARHMTQGTAAARPVIVAADGSDTVEFDGVDDTLQGATLGDVFNAGIGYAICSVIVDTVDQALTLFNGDPIFCDTGNWLGLLIEGARYRAAAYNSTGPGVGILTTPCAFGRRRPIVVEWRHEGGNIHVRVDGDDAGAQVAASGNTGDLTTAILLAAETSGTSFFTKMKFREFVTFDAVPDAATRNALVADMREHARADDYDQWVGTAGLVITGNSTGWGGNNLRQYFPAAVVFHNGSQARVTFKAGANDAASVGRAYIGHKAAAGDNYDFDGNQVQLFVGGQGSFDVAAGTEAVSDWVTISVDATKDLIVAVFFDDVNNDDVATGTQVAGEIAYFKVAADEVNVSNVTSYTGTSTGSRFVRLVEIKP